RGLRERRQVAQAALRAGSDFASGRRDRDLTVRPVDQIRAEQGFELADRDAECGLRDVASRRCATEVTVLGERDEVAQLLDRRQVGGDSLHFAQSNDLPRMMDRVDVLARGASETLP